MKIIKYFLQYIFIITLFLIFKILGYKKSSDFGSFIFKKLGYLFRSKNIIKKNLSYLNNETINKNSEKIIEEIWENYGRIFADYVSIKNFRIDKLNKFLDIRGLHVIEKIKNEGKPVVFISGHFNNFELMAMIIEKNGINLSAIYRPLNNIFLNKIMEDIRKNIFVKIKYLKELRGQKIY